MLTAEAASTRRVEELDLAEITRGLDREGCATANGLLGDDACEALKACYPREELFRSTIQMERHGFGRGEYKYFSYPLPGLISDLRRALYEKLAPVANEWWAALGNEARFPARHDEFLERCHESGQLRPTPLMLKYGAGDYNRLHQDLYGEHLFPLQTVVLLSAPGVDFDGGEFLLVEQRPRMQSRAHIPPLRKGDALIFAVNHRPQNGARGVYRAQTRHGVSQVRRGERYALGLISHDAT